MKTFFSGIIWPMLVLFAIVVLGAVLRIVPLMQRDYWFDESFTGIMIRQEMPVMMDIITRDVHPPMYYWLLKGWAMVAGSEPVALRAFSVFFGLALIVLTFVALRQWVKGSWLPAIIGALVVAINPFFVNYSQEARMYALLAFLLLLTAMLLVRSWETKSTGVRVAYACAMLAVILTHYIGAIFVLAFVVADFVQQWRAQRGEGLPVQAKWLFAGYLVPLFGGLAWLPSFQQQTAVHDTLGWVPNVPFEHLPVALHVFLFGAPVGVLGVPPVLGYRVEWLTVPAVSIALIVIFVVLITWLTLRKQWSAPLALLGLMAIGPLLVTWLLQFVGRQLFVERFLTGTAVFLVLFVVVALAKFRQKLLLAVAGIYVLFVVLIQPWHYDTPFLIPVSDVVREIADNRFIIYTNAFDYTHGRFHLGHAYDEQVLVYNVNNVEESLDGWAIVQKGSQLFTLPTKPHILVTTQPDLFPGYVTVRTVSAYSILQPL